MKMKDFLDGILQTHWKIRFSKLQVAHLVFSCTSSYRIIHIHSTVQRTALIHPILYRTNRHHETSMQRQEKGVLLPSILTASSSIERGCSKN